MTTYLQNTTRFVVCILIFLLLWLLYGGNLWNGDRDGYELYYQRDSISLWGNEVLYGYINILSRKIGLSFQEFQVIISFVTLLLVTLYLKKVSHNLGLSLIAYAIIMFPLDYVLMRNSLAFAIVLNAFIFLFYEKKITYCTLILIAGLIHSSAFLFIIFVINRNIKLRLCRYLILSIILIIIFNSFFSISLLGSKITEHLQYYGTNWKITTKLIALHCFSSIAIYTYINNKKNINKYSIFINNINILSLLLLFLYFYAPIFVRIIRLILFMNIIYVLQDVVSIRRFSLSGMFYIILFSIILFYYFIYSTLDNSLMPLFEHNILIG